MSDYKDNDIDLDTLFQPRVTTKAPDVSYRQNGSDISNLYEPLARDQRIPDISYQSNSTNLSAIFMGNDSQYSNSNVLTSTRTTSWNNTVEHVFTISFSNSTEKSLFFQYGGRIKISASRSGGTSSTKNTNWTLMLDSMGSIELGDTASYYNNTTQVSAIGQQDLTGSYSTIYTGTGSGAYSSNTVTVSALNLSVLTIQMRLRLQDGTSGTIDEDVDGTLTSTVTERKYPTLLGPTFSTITELSAGS